MISPELDKHLKKIEKELSSIESESSSSNNIWLVLWRGFIYGAGYVIGAVIVLAIVGWILNVVGVIPALDHQVAALRAAVERIK